MTITATIIQDSISNGIRITTFELEYPRFIHAELMTHRQFSRNAASSRAIPIEKMQEHVLTSPAMPVHWGANQAGMQAKAELEGVHLEAAKAVWIEAVKAAVQWSKALGSTGLHKQLANRVTEAFQMMKTVVTATQYDNWFWLRDHTDAQPEIHELASKMQAARDASVPMQLSPWQWHVPYVNREKDSAGQVWYKDVDGNTMTAEIARIVSASCCAQVSYRKSDDSVEKAKMIFDRLVLSSPVHASPVEHQASPMSNPHKFRGQMLWEEGVTHVDSVGQFWSGNFKGWIQFRQLIPNHSK